jgi:hypothetical protein
MGCIFAKTTMVEQFDPATLRIKIPKDISERERRLIPKGVAPEARVFRKSYTGASTI